MSTPKRARADSGGDAPTHIVQRVSISNRSSTQSGSAAASPSVENFNPSHIHSFANHSDMFGDSRRFSARADLDPLFNTPSPAFDSAHDFGHSMDFTHTGHGGDLGMGASPVFSTFDAAPNGFSAGPSWSTPRTAADGSGMVASPNDLSNFMQYGIYDSPGSNGTPPPVDPFDVSGLPFSGLEGFLSSFAPGPSASSGDVMDSLWSSYKGPAGTDVRFDLGLGGALVDGPDALG
jgi:hypothetical protein